MRDWVVDAVGTFTVSDPDGLDDIESIEVAGQTFTKTPGQTFAQFAQTLVDAAAIDTGYGTLEITGFVGGEFTYEYTLDTTVDNDSQAGATDTGYTESFDVSVSDGTSSASTTVSIDIADDEPQDFTSQSVVVAPGDASTTDGPECRTNKWSRRGGYCHLSVRRYCRRSFGDPGNGAGVSRW